MGSKVNLNKFIEHVSSHPFEWGRHDCLTFTNSAFEAYWGEPYAQDWIDGYMVEGRPPTARELRKTFKYSTVEAALDDRLCRCNPTKFGSLVTTKKNQRWVTGVALGISIGSRCIFLNKQGMIAINAIDTNGAWVPHEK